MGVYNKMEPISDYNNFCCLLLNEEHLEKVHKIPTNLL